MPRTHDSNEPVDPRRRLPAVGVLLATAEGRALSERFGASQATGALRAVLGEARDRLSGDVPAPDAATLIAAAADRLGDARRETLRPVINATGVIIHTNLGRAPLAPEAVAAMQAAAGYGNLEFDLDSGRRSSRHDHLDRLIAEVTGAEGGLVVNNGAGAVLLALAALASDAAVIVSRGELIEIGGGFRVPDVVAQSGARLVEVGATNRTHLRDYEAALRANPDVRAILKTHPSNFRITGFTSAPSLESLAHFAHANGLILIEDLGGGALVDLAPYGVAPEPTVQASLAAGADLVIFSGDKLLGGPQAGLIAGRRNLLNVLGPHPLARALRLDKVSLAALAATLRLFLSPSNPVERVPVLRMLTEPAGSVAARAEALAKRLADIPGLTVSTVDTDDYAGGGAMPMQPVAGRAVALAADSLDAEDLARRLRTGATAVLGRIESDRVLLDARTISDADLAALVSAVRGCLGAF